LHPQPLNKLSQCYYGDGSFLEEGKLPFRTNNEIVTTMKYKLSFCEIEQLSDEIFEVTVNEGAVIDEKCAEEGRIFWHDLRTEPYRLLVNNKNRFSYSFLGAQKIGAHSLEQKTAVLIGDEISEGQMSTVMTLKKMTEDTENKRVFQERDEAIKWLECP